MYCDWYSVVFCFKLSSMFFDWLHRISVLFCVYALLYTSYCFVKFCVAWLLMCFSFVVFVLAGQMSLFLLNKRHCIVKVAEYNGEVSPSVRNSNLERKNFRLHSATLSVIFNTWLKYVGFWLSYVQVTKSSFEVCKHPPVSFETFRLSVYTTQTENSRLLGC